MTPERLDEIEARAKTATEGPWSCERDDGMDGGIYYAIHGKGYAFVTNVDEDKNNADFIAAARTDIPDLIAEVRRLQDDYAKIQAIAEEQGAALNSLVDIEEECVRLRTALTAARSEMRERAAKMTEGWVGAIPKDIAFSIRLLPLDPDGEMT